MADLLGAGAIALTARMRAGEVTATELMQATLDRIEAVNPILNAIVALRERDVLMAEAAAPREGALSGLPIAIKDLADAEGLVTSMGSPLFAGRVATSDSLMVARLRAAGAIIIGKTNTPEFGLGSHTFNPVYGATRNPYDVSRSAGGSSGGAAVALATGMLSIADGSDMMGSLRNPAGWNNVYGFRPSWGLVPAQPEGDVFLPMLATLGPMARTVEDIALLLGVMGGPCAANPHGLDLPDLRRLEVEVRGRRIGWLGDWGGAFAMDPGMIEASERALAALDALGCHVEHIPPPFAAEAMWDSWCDLRAWETAGRLGPLYDDPALREGLKPEAVYEVERARALSPGDIQRQSSVRSAWFRAAAALFERYDGLMLPTAQCWPFDVTQDWPKEIGGRVMETYHRWMQVVVPASLIGLPALAVPGGFGEGGLPFGLQMIGPHRGDRAVLELGQAWHRATGWPQLRAPVIAGDAGRPIF